MDAAVRGLPLLGSTAPIVEEPNRSGCRKCGKEFGLFTRSRACGHCGFQYCTSCSDHQALVARKDDSMETTGYDPVNVCAFCIPNLTITASGRTQLRSQPVATLRAYMKAYGLSIPSHALEKDEIVDAVIAARGPNGCLPPRNEDYYRKHSVPNRTPDKKPRSLFSRMADMAQQAAASAQAATSAATSPSPSHPSTSQSQRPAASSSAPRPNQQTRPPPSAARPTPSPPNGSSARGRGAGMFPNPTQWNHPQEQSAYSVPSSHPYGYRPPGAPSPPPPPSAQTRPTGTHGAGRPAGAGPATRPAPQQAEQERERPQTPSMDALLEMSSEGIHALSVHALKDILYENHVIASQILEKEDLVSKVQNLVDNERRDRAREAEIHALEEEAYIEQQRVMREEFVRQQAEREAARNAAQSSRMSVDITPPTPGEHEGEAEHEHGDGEHQHEHLDVSGSGDHDHAHSPSRSVSPANVPLPGTSGSPTPSAFSGTAPVPKASYNAPPATVERSGLCVICQDEEANIVVVDCGHLAMCRNCSDLVMNTNRECPLCRTRIVTPQRLLRVFRT